MLPNNYLVTILLFCSLIFSSYASWGEWDGTPFDQLIGFKIRIEVLKNPGDLNPTKWLWPSPDWDYWKPYILAATSDKNQAITFTIKSATAKSQWVTPATPYTTYQYTGWKLTLSNDVRGNVWYWQTNYAIDDSAAASPIIFADQTYSADYTLRAPYIWMLQPDQWYPNGLTAGGSTCLISANQPIGHNGWVTDDKKSLAKYKIWVDIVKDIKIWSCDETSSQYHFDPAVIRYLAQTADSITIKSNLNPTTEYVTTASPNSYALDSLRVGRSLAFTANGGNAITSDWVGPKVSAMYNAGTPPNTDFFVIPYWACDNQNGLHIGNVYDNWCKWDWSQPNTPGGISIWITRNLDANIPIWRCEGPSRTRLLTSTIAVQAIGSQTKGITIYSTKTPSDYVTTASPNAYAITSLKAGKSLAFQTNGGYAISSDWVGSKTSNMWNSCGTPGFFIDDPYWACNNGYGLHLRPNACNWVSDTNSPPGGISISIQPLVKPAARLLRIWSCTSSGTYSMDFSLAVISSFATEATAVTIMTRRNPEEYVTSTSSSFALQSLAAGKSLSHSTTNGYTQTTQWVGTRTDNVWNSCGTVQAFDSIPYWACNNGNGIHLSPTICGWTPSGIAPTGGIGIYLHMPTY